MKKKKKIMLFMVFVVVGLIAIMRLGDFVSAATIIKQTDDANKTKVCFNQKTGAFVKSYSGKSSSCGSSTTYGTDAVKLIGGKYAYCVQWQLDARSYNYIQDTSWKKNTDRAIMAGYLINYVNAQYSSMPQKYSMTAATLNTFFSRYIKDSNSMNFYSTNSTIKKYYDQAISYYNSYVKGKLTNKLPNVNIVATNDVFNYTGTDYISSKITLSNLKAVYGGSGDTVKYTVAATASNGAEVQICSDHLGKNCQKTVTLTGRSADYPFYLKVSKDAINSNHTVTLRVSGSNTSVYPSSVRYKNSDYGNSQDLLVVDQYSVSRSVSKSMQFTVPDLENHKIHVYKVDENGENLEGVTLELYKDDVSVSSNLLKSNNGVGSSLSYTTPLVAEGNDDFFAHDYYLVEKNAPDGYIFSPVNKFYSKGSATGKVSLVCYYNGGSESEQNKEVEYEFCKFENYEYKCQSSTGEFLDLDESGNCDFNVPDVEQGGNEGAEGSGDNGNVTNPDEENPTPGEEEEPKVTYSKVCYNKEKNGVAENEAYCSDKESYTRVYNDGNNISIRQVNSRNLIRISKRAITGDEEVSGANLKICTAASYESKKDECEAAKTVDDIEMSWISGENPHEFSGVPKGIYYIIEVTPPSGYVRATTATKFSIDEKGEVKTGDKVITNEDFRKDNAVIVIENELTSISISKQDVATSKELPGATISICRTYIDENEERQLLVNQYTGNCIEAVLADGSNASWVSTNEPKEIKGLSAGTYYLVEKIAPTDYSTAESIMFTLKDDGTLVDKDGNSLKEKKLIMYDKKIEEVKTGALSTYLVGGIFVVVIGIGIGSYYYLRSPKAVEEPTNKKIRKRRVHKK